MRRSLFVLYGSVSGKAKWLSTVEIRSRVYISLHGFASRLIEHCPYGACLELDILHVCEATIGAAGLGMDPGRRRPRLWNQRLRDEGEQCPSLSSAKPQRRSPSIELDNLSHYPKEVEL